MEKFKFDPSNARTQSQDYTLRSITIHFGRSQSQQDLYNRLKTFVVEHGGSGQRPKIVREMIRFSLDHQ